MTMKIKLINVRPGGNDTCLIEKNINSDKKRKFMNDKIMKLYPNIEQVGFVNLNRNRPELIMAGNEFCANATRSTAYLALKGNPGIVKIRVSGVKKRLTAGVSKNGEAFTEIPIFEDSKKIVRDQNNPNGYVVELEGITQYINLDENKIKNLSKEEIIKKAKQTIDKLGLNKYPAAGVVYVNTNLSIIPIVWVRKINTLFLETACGSATAALGQILALKNGSSIKNLPIYQPSGMPIKISVAFDGKRFKYAEISGPIIILETKNILI